MYEALIQQIENTSDVAFGPFGDGLSEERIQAAEAALRISFPDSYRWWLRNYGGGQIRGDIVYGLDVDNQGRPDVVLLAELNRELYSNSELVICDGNEESFYLDLGAERISGEYPVIHHDIDMDEREFYSESFAGFLAKRISQLCRK